MEQYHRRNLGNTNQRMYQSSEDRKMFVLPEDYDQTPKVKERWDERMLDIDVARVMRMLIHPTPRREFAKEDPEFADNFYTAPYSKFAQEQFGFEASLFKRINDHYDD